MPPPYTGRCQCVSILHEMIGETLKVTACHCMEC